MYIFLYMHQEIQIDKKSSQGDYSQLYVQGNVIGLKMGY